MFSKYDVYTTVQSVYCYSRTDVLKNKLNIRDNVLLKKAEEEITSIKQMKLIDDLHEKGAEVLISTHIHTYTPAQRVLKIALEHQRRGSDIAKIVTGASTMEEQLENLKIINLLKENLKIPFLFLAGGECHILRRIGGELGNCMCLCVHEDNDLATPVQPLLKHVKAIRDNMKG